MRILASYAAGLPGTALDAALERHARRGLIDWFAAVFAGRDLPAPRLLAVAGGGAALGGAALGAAAGSGRAFLYTDGSGSDLRRAALVNGAACHAAEFDDSFRDAGYHPGAATIAAALACAQAGGGSLQGLLGAIVAGYEVSGRIALALQPGHYRHWHTSATVGTFGAAAAAAVIMRLDVDRTAHALALAATMAGGLQHSLRGHSMAKAIQVGHAAEAGCLAALAAAQGATGDLDVLHGAIGYAAATSGNAGSWDQALAGLGVRHLIGEITFKQYGCSGHAIAALDALVELERRHGFTAAQVAQIDVAGYAATKDICDRPEVHDATQARHSLQYCAAALLLTGGVRPQAFTAERLADPKLRALMARISVRLDPQIAAEYPLRRAARVTVTLSDGRVLERDQRTRCGDPDAPLSDQALADKFIELSRAALGAASAGALLTRLSTGSELPMAECFAHGGRPESKPARPP